MRVILYVGYPKQDKLEHIIQKATELGAARIVPFFSRFCVAAPKTKRKSTNGMPASPSRLRNRRAGAPFQRWGFHSHINKCWPRQPGRIPPCSAMKKAARPYIAGWPVETPSPSSPAARAVFPRGGAGRRSRGPCACGPWAAHSPLRDSAPCCAVCHDGTNRQFTIAPRPLFAGAKRSLYVAEKKQCPS